MINRLALEAVDRTLRDTRKSQEIFGGILFILSGDFRQTLPVIPGGTRANEIDACIKSSELWQHIQKFSLTTNMRVHLYNDSNAAVFADQLLTVGNGLIPYQEGTHFINIPVELGKVVNSEEMLISEVYRNLPEHYENVEWLMERAILAPLNETVNDINTILINRIAGELREYKSVDTVENEDEATCYPTEFLNSLQPAGIPPHTLQLKIGLPLMVVRNLAPGIANGTRVILKRMMEKCLETVIATGYRKGEQFFLPMISLTPSDSDLPFNYTRRQFPVKPALAMTINKSQGQTLKMAGMHLDEPCFSHGQFYVGCSRVSSNKNLFIHTESNSTKNVVYQEVLQ